MAETKNKVDELCYHAMKDQWSQVFEMLEQDWSLWTAKISSIGDTVLHMAMYAPAEEMKVVAGMVDYCDQKKMVVGVLDAVNVKGNTPLHLAASIGNVEMCKQIGGVYSSLIAKRNENGETPLFLAALYGRREAFLWLHYLYEPSLEEGASSTNCSHCIRDNKDTILHCAIAQEHFDVAIEIVYLYEDLVKETMLNEEGLSPLHLLAEKPLTFKSGLFLGRPFGQLAYYFLGDMTKHNATTKVELEASERKSCLMALKDAVINKWLKKKRKENKWLDFIFKSKIWVLLHFEIVGQSIYELVGVVRRKKENHTWACQIMDKLLDHGYSFDDTDCTEIETPLQIAAKNGVTEMVEKIMEKFPSTVKIDGVDKEGKNIVLLAVENRQANMYMFLCERKSLTESLFHEVDKDGNSALHLAARYGVERNWSYPGEVLVMQWEYKWLKFVRDSMPPGVFATYNKKRETPTQIFHETHKDQNERDQEWLSQTSGACSLVSTLIATVAFATAATVPGGFNSEHGSPIFLHKPVYQFFVAMSLAALCLAIIATLVLLSLVTARHHVAQFYRNLPLRLFIGMSTMFISILCMWISFCSSHSFLLIKPERKIYVAIYIIASFPGTLYAITKFPVFWDLLSTSFNAVPASSRNVVPARRSEPWPENNRKLLCAEVLDKVVKICEGCDDEK